jgi:hypothetical protein
VEPCVAPEERVEVPAPIRTPGGLFGSGQARMLRQCTRKLTHFKLRGKASEEGTAGLHFPWKEGK